MRYLKFLDGSIDPALAMLATYDPGLVTLSYVIASLASYTALRIAGRISAADRAVGERAWLAFGAVAMGSGVWAMHFIGMLAYRLPVTVTYDLATTLLSMAPAILAGGVVLHVISRAKIERRQLIVGGTLMGAGIGVMHYTGMAAMRMDAFIRYDPVLFGVSIIVAVLLAIIALYIKFWASRQLAKPYKHVTELGSALVMGLAVAGMHYTAMQSTYCFATGDPTGVDAVFSPTLLGASVGAVSVFIITLSIIATVVGRRLAAAASSVSTSRGQMLEAIESISEGFALYDAEDRLVLCNTRYREGLAEISDILKPGVRFEEVIRALAERGLVPDAKGRIEDLVRERLHLHRTLGKLTEQPFGDDQWVQTDRYRTKDGGTVIIRTDITERKRAEEEIRDLARFPEQNPDPVLRFTEDGALLYANPASALLMNELKFGIGEPAPEDWRRMFAEVLETNSPKEFEYEYSGLTLSFVISPVPETGYVNVHGRNITQRKRAENAMRESEQRLQAITGNLFEGVLVVDANGHIFFANRSAETLLLGAGKLAGRDADDIFLLRDGAKATNFADSPFRRVAETGETLRNDDAVFVINEGKSLNVAYACSPLLENAKRCGAIISFRDIRELKEAQGEAIQASKLASVGQLAGGIAHEINTPIQYIGDNLRFLGKAHGDIATVLAAYGALAKAAREAGVLGDTIAAVDKAVEEADLDYLLEELPVATEQSLGGTDQVSRIVLAMKEFSHPGTKEKAATDLNAAIESTLTVCRNEWKHVAEVDMDLDPALPPVVCLAGELNQVFLNLIVNGAHAIESSCSGGQGRIRVSTRKDGDWVEIKVADTGGGIPDDIRDKIFDPFFTTKEVGRGTGQGLAICRDIVVNKHGGKLLFETEQGKGTTFVIRLPLDGQTKPSEAA